jgi:hypothetical protein
MTLRAATDDAIASTPSRRAARLELAVLLIAALALYTANPFGIRLPAMDDCFYARKGVEMARSGGFFSVTWNGSPEFQNPSLQIWILGRSFALFGEKRSGGAYSFDRIHGRNAAHRLSHRLAAARHQGPRSARSRYSRSRRISTSMRVAA